MDRKIKVIGCPRSGTTFFAKYLQERGLDVKHENQSGKDGIVSWKETFKSDPSKDYIIHLVRDPFHVIPSMMSIKDSSWKVFQKRNIFQPADTKPIKALKTWLYITKYCDMKALYTVRVESIRHTKIYKTLNSRGLSVHKNFNWEKNFLAPGGPQLLVAMLKARHYFGYRNDSKLKGANND